jgi:hypothetical protein
MREAHVSLLELSGSRALTQFGGAAAAGPRGLIFRARATDRLTSPRMPLTARQQLVLVEAVAEIDTPYPGSGDVGPRWDGLVLTIRNRLMARYRTAVSTGFDKPGIMLSPEQVAQILTQLVDKGLLVVARGADYTRRVTVTDAGRAELPTE